MNFDYLRNQLSEARTIQIKSEQKHITLGLIKNESGIVHIFTNSVLVDKIHESELFDNVASAIYQLPDAKITTDNDLVERESLI